MIPYSRPKLSDFYILFQTKLLKNCTLHSCTYLCNSLGRGGGGGGGIDAILVIAVLIIIFFRVTCSEVYFIEELLYADEESLENCKDLELIVCTLENGLMQNKENFHQNESAVEAEGSLNSKHLDLKGKECEKNPTEQERHKFSVNTVNTHLEVEKTGFGSELKTLEKEPSAFEAHNSEITCKGKRKSEINLDKSEGCDTVQSGCSVSSTIGNESSYPFTEHKEGQSIDGVTEVSGFCNILLNAILQENSFILDVDMDYFSTQNPFKLLYTEVSVKGSGHNKYTSLMMIHLV